MNLKIHYAWKNKGLALHSLKKYLECQKAFEQALRLNPKDAETCNILTEYYLMFGDINNALNYAEKALLIDKENSVSLSLKGKIKIEEQDYTTSIRYFKKAISLDLRNPRIHFYGILMQSTYWQN